MKEHSKFPSLVFIGLIAFTVIVSVVAFAGAVSWINKPFAGFLTFPFPHLASYSDRDWPGTKAGLKFRERIVAIDGQSVRHGRDLVNTVRQKEAGTQVNYQVESKGKIREVVVPVTIFGIKDFFLVFILTFLGGLIVCTLGVIVFLLKPNTTISWVFLVLSLCLGTYMISGFEIASTYNLPRLNALVVCLVPATLFQFFLIFPDKKRMVARWPVLEYIIYIPALIIALGFQIYLTVFKKVTDSSSLPWVSTYEGINTMVRFFMFFCLVGFVIFLIHSMYKATTVQARQRARVILFGVTMAFTPPVIIMFLVSFFKVNFPWNFFPIFIIFFPASIAYSIVRHNLFDADTIIKRTVGYFVVTAIVIGAYALVSVFFNVVMGKYQLTQSKTFPILFTLGVILVFNPLRDRIQALVDRVFFRKEYDYGDIVEKMSGAMTSLLELPQILKRLTQTFMEDMFIDTSSVMLLTSDGTQYKVYLADGERKEDVEKKFFKRDDPLLEIIEKEKGELTKYDVLEDPKFKEVSEPCAENFEALHASLIVPLVYQDQVIGSLNLGEKKSGKPFNREDIDLLRTLAHQGAIAIENARLFQENLEKQRMEEELNIARDLQVSMLPAECPTVEGFDIAAYCVSAREVGGDFYDFIDMGEDKVGFVIGDVTGKSVSGALVMSASRSVFRILSEEDLGVSDSMMRANSRLKKDIKSGMFVALLFAVLDSQDKSLILCSAGQTQPVLMSAKTAKTALVETQGDTFPLGILEDASYEETLLQLEPGDRVVLYTDGIVEAMNEQEEMFGFEKLQEVIKTSTADTAEALMNDIIASVGDFTGDAPQHDDITVIVLSVAK